MKANSKSSLALLLNSSKKRSRTKWQWESVHIGQHTTKRNWQWYLQNCLLDSRNAFVALANLCSINYITTLSLLLKAKHCLKWDICKNV